MNGIPFKERTRAPPTWRGRAVILAACAEPDRSGTRGAPPSPGGGLRARRRRQPRRRAGRHAACARRAWDPPGSGRGLLCRGIERRRVLQRSDIGRRGPARAAVAQHRRQGPDAEWLGAGGHAAGAAGLVGAREQRRAAPRPRTGGAGRSVRGSRDPVPVRGHRADRGTRGVVLGGRAARPDPGVERDPRHLPAGRDRWRALHRRRRRERHPDLAGGRPRGQAAVRAARWHVRPTAARTQAPHRPRRPGVLDRPAPPLPPRPRLVAKGRRGDRPACRRVARACVQRLHQDPGADRRRLCRQPRPHRRRRGRPLGRR